MLQKTNIITPSPHSFFLQASDAGRYTCHAENEIDLLDTNFELEVLAAPRFGASVQRAYQVVEGAAVSLVCPAEANPTPVISWLRNDEPIESRTGKYQVAPNSKVGRMAMHGFV